MLNPRLRERFRLIKSLRVQIILLYTSVLLFSILLLSLFSIKLFSESVNLWRKEQAEQVLERVLREGPEGLRVQAEGALREYRQIRALQPLIKREIIKFSILLSIFAFCTSSFLFWFFIRRLTKPLTKVILTTRAISKGILSDEALKAKSAPIEISPLLEAFRGMIRSLRLSQTELRKAERMAAWRDVAQMFAHEVKNPLTPIQLSIERIRKKYGGEDFERVLYEESEIVFKEINHLKRFTREFSNFVTPPPPLTLKEEQIKGVVEECVALYSGRAEGVNFEVEYGEVPPILVDREALRRAIINLVRNGIEAMPDGGILNVSIGREDEFAFIEIKDTGLGIQEEDLPNLFVPHYSRKKEGFGLGLAIAHDIVAAHHGEIRVESKVGKGTAFKILLPISTKRKEEDAKENFSG